jgi:hypothetical protein
MNNKSLDPQFLTEYAAFTYFTHGPAVASIIGRNAPNNKIIGVKVWRTTNPEFLFGPAEAQVVPGETDPQRYVEALARQQVEIIQNAIGYVQAVGADVANGSIAYGLKSTNHALERPLTRLLERKPDADEATRYSRIYVNKMLSLSSKMLDAAPETLFVFGANNDAVDNDVFPTFPANLSSGNSLTVAATFARTALAEFSSYGAETVDVAAPGVHIPVEFPGGLQTYASGTSHATAYVSRVAGLIKDAARALRPSEMRRILVETVDTKSFLVGKIKSAGIVNPDRALMAAQLSNTMDLGDAIVRAKEMVPDVIEKSD